MVQLPDFILPTVDAIYNHYEVSNGDWRRNHLGASLIGNKCERALWYSFRWAGNPQFKGRMLRLFETGNQQESRIVKNLRDIGVTVYDLDPETGKQIRYASHGGHYAGSCDGVAQGFKESKQWHIIEIKTMNTKTFGQLKKNGVMTTKFEHYCQMQQYMNWAGLERAYYFAVCKEDDSIYGERVSLDKELAKRLELKAERIIFSDNAPFQISDSDNDPTCRFCAYKEICRGIRLPEINCRTCAFANPEENGTWKCCRGEGHILCGDEQRAVQDCHVFIPDFVPMEQTDANPEKGTITYGVITNGPGAILSKDLEETIGKIASGEGESPQDSEI